MTPAFARFESTDEKVKGSVIGIDLGTSIPLAINVPESSG